MKYVVDLRDLSGAAEQGISKKLTSTTRSDTTGEPEFIGSVTFLVPASRAPGHEDRACFHGHSLHPDVFLNIACSVIFDDLGRARL